MLLWVQTPDGAWDAVQVPCDQPLEVAPGVAVLSWEDGRASGVFVRGPAEINGSPSLTFQVLEHRDELRIDDKHVYVSRASNVEARPFEPSDAPVQCGRCGMTPEAAALVKHCPLCSALHHADCFDYDIKCGACHQPTSWTPEDEGPGDKEGASWHP